MPGNLSEKELNEFHELFKLVDTDGRGYISRQELRKLMDTLHLQPTEEELETLFDEAHSFAPASGNASTSRIDVKQFVEVMSRRVQSDYTPEQLRNAFKVFSTDDLPEGYVSTVVIRHALVTYASEKLSVEEADRLLDAVDPEGTGMINYYDFVSLVSGK